jgi:hypothetical protein
MEDRGTKYQITCEAMENDLSTASEIGLLTKYFRVNDLQGRTAVQAAFRHG